MEQDIILKFIIKTIFYISKKFTKFGFAPYTKKS